VLVQVVRLLDVFWLGPLLIRLARRGYTARSLSRAERDLLTLTGVGTIVFNGVRFLEGRD
jgi:hypothetical protein